MSEILQPLNLIDDDDELERCPWCGFMVNEPCDVPTYHCTKQAELYEAK